MNDAATENSPGRRHWARSIRGMHLLEDEKVVGLLDGSTGLTEAPTPSGPLLALTNRRVIALLDIEDRKETHVASIDKVQGVSIRAHKRPSRPLAQGVVLILVGILVYLVVGTFSTGIPVSAGITIGALLGGAVAILGLLFIIKYLFWEQGGELVFQTGGLELTFVYNSEKTALSVYRLLRRFFHLQAGMDVKPLYPYSSSPGWPPLLRMAPAPEPTPPAPEASPVPTTAAVTTPQPARRSQRKRLRRRKITALIIGRIHHSSRLSRNGTSRHRLRTTRTELRNSRLIGPLRRRKQTSHGENGRTRIKHRISRRRTKVR